VEKIHTETPVDSFVARYPEPSRVNKNDAQQPKIATASAQIQPVTILQQQPTVMAEQPAPVQQQATAQTVTDTQPVYTTHNSAATAQAAQIQVEQTPVTHSHSSVIPPYAPPREEQKTAKSSLNLTPPLSPTIPSQQSVSERKTPSLFERITGRNRQDVDVSDEKTDTSSSGSTGNGGYAPNTITAERKTVVSSYDAPVPNVQNVGTQQQGMLPIDAPAVQAKPSALNGAADLEIPAFLRRQIS
jgi:hypothetical protein